MPPKDSLADRLVVDPNVFKELADVAWVTKVNKQWEEIGKQMAAVSVVAPKLSLPDFSLPKFSLPEIAVPSVSLPDFSKLDLTESVKRGVREMAMRGWTIQMSLTLADIEELVATSEEETDAFFVAFYTEDNFAILRRVREELVRRPALGPWKELLEQCFEAFERGHHLVTVPALLSVIEGVIATAGQALTSHRVHLVKICSENSAKSGSTFLAAAMWESVGLFVEKLFQKAPFDNARPGFINRHWILHGRDSATWKDADALRLFNALQTVDSLLD